MLKKLDLCGNGMILGDEKMVSNSNKPFIGHPDATLFWISFRI
jgi:hypothetical protein